MNKVRALVKQLCPVGVPVKTLGDVGTFVRGGGLQKADLVDAGVSAIHYGQVHTYYGTFATETRSYVRPDLAARLRKAEPGDLVIATTSEDDEAVGKAMAWLGDSAAAISGDAYIYRHSLVPKYAAYFFQSRQFQDQKKRRITGAKVRRISGEGLAQIAVPVPPVEVQEEIVRVLDSLADLKGELKAALEAELKARRAQYAFYRDLLFTFTVGQEVPWRRMSEVGEFFRGRRFTKDDVVPNGLASMHYGEIYTGYGVFADKPLSRVRPDLASSLRFAKKGDVVVAAVGETVEDVAKAVAWLGDEDVAIHDDCFAFRHSLNPKFVAYYFQTARFHAEKNKYVARAKVKRISGESLGKMLIPVPDRAAQDRIVETLDKFDALLKDLLVCLPEEVRARQAQYEHYRDSLLTFEEAVA